LINLEQINDFGIVGWRSNVLKEVVTDPLAQTFKVLLGESMTQKIGFSVDELNQIGCQLALVFLHATSTIRYDTIR